MKRGQAIYSEGKITYWPAYEAGKIGLIFLGGTGALFTATSLWILLDDPSRGTQRTILVLFPLIFVALYVAICFVLRAMRTKIVISKEGIEYFKNMDTIDKQIDWKDVGAVSFTQELWYGRKACQIFLSKAKAQSSRKKDECDFLLPVQSVDEQTLLQLIPEHLWKNKLGE